VENSILITTYIISIELLSNTIRQRLILNAPIVYSTWCISELFHFYLVQLIVIFFLLFNVQNF